MLHTMRHSRLSPLWAFVGCPTQTSYKICVMPFHALSYLPFIPFHFPMSSADAVRPASYVPRRFASGTFPVSRNYNLRQMLYNYSYSRGRVDLKGDSSDQVIPSFPFSDVPVYADTVDIESKLACQLHQPFFFVVHTCFDSSSAGVSRFLGLSFDARQCCHAHLYRRPPLSCLGGHQARRRV